MTDTAIDDSWRARARDRMHPLKARALAELLMQTPGAYVLVDAAVGAVPLPITRKEQFRCRAGARPIA